MRRLPVAFLLLALLSLHSGLLPYVHNLEHLHAHRPAAGGGGAPDDGLGAEDGPGHEEEDHHHGHGDESDCRVHAQLRAPAIAESWAPGLIVVGAAPTPTARPAVAAYPQRAPRRITCRGPPAL